MLATSALGLRGGLLTAVGVLYFGAIGLWDESLETVALMTVAVGISVGIGVPLGIASARYDRLQQVLRPVLDAMQTLPAFVYLIPVVLLFGVARVPAIMASVVYALPPVVRLTDLGIRNVPRPTVEAAEMFGATPRQTLRKVQFPLALPSVLTGINQTIMMALSIVVIAALIGAGGLGQVVLESLRRLFVGRALEAGLAIVVLAMIMDRLTYGAAGLKRRRRLRLMPDSLASVAPVARVEGALAALDRFLCRAGAALARPLTRTPGDSPLARHPRRMLGAVALVAGVAASTVFGRPEFPSAISVSFAGESTGWSTGSGTTSTRSAAPGSEQAGSATPSRSTRSHRYANCSAPIWPGRWWFWPWRWPDGGWAARRWQRSARRAWRAWDFSACGSCPWTPSPR